MSDGARLLVVSRGVWIALLAAGSLLAAERGAAQSDGRTERIPLTDPRAHGPCTMAGPDVRRATRAYAVLGRARLLLVWTGRREIGDARIGWYESVEARRLELLIGTDPARAPRKMNRWGYITESICGDQAHMLGLMTPADEDSIDEAEASLAKGAARGLKAVRSSIDGASVRTERFWLASDPKTTYRQLDALLAALPARRAAPPTPRPAGVDPGFLSSVEAVLRQAIDAPRANGGSPSVPPRKYLYSGKVYDLTMKKARDVATLTTGGRTYTHLVDAEFALRNTTTGEVTTFGMAFGTRGDLAAVPVRIAYKPRWWLEVELQLAGQ